MAETPIYSMLENVRGAEACGTFHGQPGGEWDVLRATPLKLRQSLTSAGYFRLHGMKADVFASHLVDRAGPLIEEYDPIEWYIRTAWLAMKERQVARRAASKKAFLRHMGVETYYEWRDTIAVIEGYRSYFDRRDQQARAAGHRSYFAARNERAVQEGYQSYWDKLNSEARAEGHESYRAKLAARSGGPEPDPCDLDSLGVDVEADESASF